MTHVLGYDAVVGGSGADAFWVDIPGTRVRTGEIDVTRRNRRENR